MPSLHPYAKSFHSTYKATKVRQWRHEDGCVDAAELFSGEANFCFVPKLSTRTTQNYFGFEQKMFTLCEKFRIVETRLHEAMYSEI